MSGSLRTGLFVYPLMSLSPFSNCLFRALSAQLGDRRTDHRQLRQDVVQYMREHRDEFEPFIDDHTSFNEYSMWLFRVSESTRVRQQNTPSCP